MPLGCTAKQNLFSDTNEGFLNPILHLDDKNSCNSGNTHLVAPDSNAIDQIKKTKP